MGNLKSWGNWEMGKLGKVGKGGGKKISGKKFKIMGKVGYMGEGKNMYILYMSIISMILVILLMMVVSGVGVYCYMEGHYRGVVKREGCPYGRPCMVYNGVQTREAMKRVVKLLLSDMERKAEYREELRKYLIDNNNNGNNNGSSGEVK